MIAWKFQICWPFSASNAISWSSMVTVNTRPSDTLGAPCSGGSVRVTHRVRPVLASRAVISR